MSKSKLPSRRSLQKVLAESIPENLQSPGPVQIILEQGDPSYYIKRSIEFLRSYIHGEGFGKEQAMDCAQNVDTLSDVIFLLGITKLELVKRLENYGKASKQNSGLEKLQSVRNGSDGIGKQGPAVSTVEPPKAD
jgi:hypothetical protein